MPKKHDDSPYAESPSRAGKPAAKPAPKPAAKPAARPVAKHPPKPAAPHPVKHAAMHAPAHPVKHVEPSASPAKRGRSRRKSAAKAGGPSRGAKGSTHGLTSAPTSRGAMSDTREWLLKHYGPYCAYCGEKFSPRVITLDHVAPRRGQTAYDRRDNLVIACKDCNAKKRDQSPLAFLLAVRTRAANLMKYGKHLSAGLLDLARPLVAPEEPKPRVRFNAAYENDDPSPYKD